MKKDRLTDVIARLCELYDMRVCQLISNAVPTEVKHELGNDFYYIDDDEMLRYLWAYVDRVNGRTKEN